MVWSPNNSTPGTNTTVSNDLYAVKVPLKDINSMKRYTPALGVPHLTVITKSGNYFLGPVLTDIKKGLHFLHTILMKVVSGNWFIHCNQLSTWFDPMKIRTYFMSKISITPILLYSNIPMKNQKN